MITILTWTLALAAWFPVPMGSPTQKSDRIFGTQAGPPSFLAKHYPPFVLFPTVTARAPAWPF